VHVSCKKFSGVADAAKPANDEPPIRSRSLRREDGDVVAVEDFGDFSHIRLRASRESSQFGKELFKVGTGHNGPKRPAGFGAEVTERMRDVPGENDHRAGRGLLNLLVELVFKFALKNANEFVFMTMDVQRHARARRGYGFKDKIFSVRLTTGQLDGDFVAEHEKFSGCARWRGLPFFSAGWHRVAFVKASSSGENIADYYDGRKRT